MTQKNKFKFAVGDRVIYRCRGTGGNFPLDGKVGGKDGCDVRAWQKKGADMNATKLYVIFHTGGGVRGAYGADQN